MNQFFASGGQSIGVSASPSALPKNIQDRFPLGLTGFISLQVCIVKTMVFLSSHARMWELDHKEGWVPKNWYFWTVVLEKTLESPLDCKEIQQVHPKGNQSWIFDGRTDGEAETPILWPPDAKNWLIPKVPDAGNDWNWEEKGWQRRWLDGITDSMDMSLSNSWSWWWTGRPGVLQSMGW